MLALSCVFSNEIAFSGLDFYIYINFQTNSHGMGFEYAGISRLLLTNGSVQLYQGSGGIEFTCVFVCQTDPRS